MAVEERLPLPRLSARRFGARRLPALTDDALFSRTGVRIAFTGREGGESQGPFASLNLGDRVNDDPARVRRNRALLLRSIGAEGLPLLGAAQVHGREVVELADGAPAKLERSRALAARGADALVVGACEVAALLCFADCVPLVVVSPTGRFALVHAGWRGVLNGVAARAVDALSRADGAGAFPGGPAGAQADFAPRAQAYNVYVGPHIHAECFETGSEVAERFERRFGAGCLADARHVDLLAALEMGLAQAGVSPERIVDAGVCTACSSEDYFSYRASGGVCGRQGAIAFRKRG